MTRYFIVDRYLHLSTHPPSLLILDVSTLYWRKRRRLCSWPVALLHLFMYLLSCIYLVSYLFADLFPSTCLPYIPGHDELIAVWKHALSSDLLTGLHTLCDCIFVVFCIFHIIGFVFAVTSISRQLVMRSQSKAPIKRSQHSLEFFFRADVVGCSAPPLSQHLLIISFVLEMLKSFDTAWSQHLSSWLNSWDRLIGTLRVE